VLANALRLGWLVLPERLAAAVARERIAADGGAPVVEQLALADLLARGDVDRHLRRTRRLYRGRRDALARALAEHLPGAEVVGAAAGLHAMAVLPPGTDAAAVRDAAAAAGVVCHVLEVPAGAAVVLGYAHLGEPAIERAVAALGAAVALTV
jgi:GntR family transcriptional regulator/MocR family aminotransferase